MLQVTSDLNTTLRDLERRMGQLVRWRDTTIREAERIIRDTNHEFDEIAVELGREINELRERLQRTDEPKPIRVRAARAPKNLDGLDDEDQQHYRELLTKRKGKR